MKRRLFIQALAGSSLGTLVGGCGVTTLWSDPLQGLFRRTLAIEHDLCIGCRRCEEVCQAANRERPAGGGSAESSLIQIHTFVPGPYHVAWSCLGCPDAPCVAACDYYVDPFRHRKALSINGRTGAIELHRDGCAGCERCIDACQRRGAGVLRWDDHEYVYGACHLCGGEPACAEVCPTQAIRLREVGPDDPKGRQTPDHAARRGIAQYCSDEEWAKQTRVSEQPLRTLQVAADKCTGCRLCEAACDERNQRVTEDGRLLPGPGDRTRALIRIRSFPGPYYVPWSCRGCAELPCVAACRLEAFGEPHRRALHVDPEAGAVRCNIDWCVQCGSCVDACQSSGPAVLRRDFVAGVTGACHLCGGEPACVAACPFEALEMVVVDRLGTDASRRPEQVARAGTDRLYGLDGEA